MPFICYCYLIGLAKTSRITLNKTREERVGALVLQVLEYNIPYGFVICGLYYVEVCSFYS